MMISFGKTMISLNLSKEELVLTYALIVYCEDRPNLTQGKLPYESNLGWI